MAYPTDNVIHTAGKADVKTYRKGVREVYVKLVGSGAFTSPTVSYKDPVVASVGQKSGVTTIPSWEFYFNAPLSNLVGVQVFLGSTTTSSRMTPKVNLNSISNSSGYALLDFEAGTTAILTTDIVWVKFTFQV